MKRTSGLKLGNNAPYSGQYVQLGPRGGRGPEITAIAGRPLPPTPKAGMSYKLADKTRHKK